jgi:hypothetical protein
LRRIDFDQPVVGAIPLSVRDTPPNDQTPCVAEDCPGCLKPMWVSEKKRAFREVILDTQLYCFLCIVQQAREEGLELHETPAEIPDFR